MRVVCRVLLLVAVLAFAGGMPAQAKRVLLLYDERPELPGLAMLDWAIARSLAASRDGPVEIYRESLDLSRFGSAEEVARLSDFLRSKYAAKPIDVVVTPFLPSLQLMLQSGPLVFPGASIAFCCIDARELAQLPLSSNMTGVMLKRRFDPTLALALRLHPGTERVVVVAGTSRFDTRTLDLVRDDLRSYENRVSIEYLTRLPLEQVLERVAQLPPRTVILFTSMFNDGAGVPHIPHDVVEKIAARANAPVYGFLDQYVGRGIVGGEVYTLADQGNAVAALVLRLLRGEPATAMPPHEQASIRAMFDHRQLERWRISETKLPTGADIRFRTETLWDTERSLILAAGTLILLQSVTIAALLVQRRRRVRAELELQRRRVELTHAGRLATAGELAATVAHEVNQPLGAILANVAAAEMLFGTADLPREEIHQVLADMRRDAVRASEVIKRLRALIAKRETARSVIEIRGVISDVVELLGVEARRRSVEITVEPGDERLRVFGDRVQLQQVLVNLILNAMDAMVDTPVTARRVVVRALRHADGEIEIVVTDRGHGLTVEQMSKLFGSFFTTKPQGMGLGLSISQSIVAAHGGRIWAEPRSEGAAFHVTLPPAEKLGARMQAFASLGPSTSEALRDSAAPAGSPRGTSA